MFYRAAYVLLGAFLGAVAGYLFAKYSIMFFGIFLHLWSPEHYSFEHVVSVWLSTSAWLRPLMAAACGVYAAVACYRFAWTSARPT